RQIDAQGYVQTKAFAVIPFTDAHTRRNRGVFRHFHLATSSDEFQRAEETGGVTRGEQLLRVGTCTTAAAQFLRGIQGDAQSAVGGRGLSSAATSCSCFSAIQYVHVTAPFVLWIMFIAITIRTTPQTLCQA